jgi:transcriptional regulator with XRE-family HTH domain
MVDVLGWPQNVHMAKKTKATGHFIRAWRKHRDFTLERLAERVGTTHATLSRIERGKVPYSQALLEALAEALGTTPASLIMRDPAQPDAIWDIWEQIPAQDRDKAVKILEAFKKTG